MVNRLVKILEHTTIIILLLVSSFQTMADSREKNVNAESLTYEESICPINYLLCRKAKDAEGEKKIVVQQVEKNEAIYDAIEKENFTYQYTKLYVKVYKNNRLQSKIYDFNNDCHGNAGAFFITNSLKVTDINNNGIKEVTFLYDILCENDTFPPKMKLIMIEGKNKYKIRGQKKSFIETWDIEGTNFNIDPLFELADNKLLNYAVQQWSQFVYSGDKNLNSKQKEKWENYNMEITRLKNEFIKNKQ